MVACRSVCWGASTSLPGPFCTAACQRGGPQGPSREVGLTVATRLTLAAVVACTGARQGASTSLPGPCCTAACQRGGPQGPSKEVGLTLATRLTLTAMVACTHVCQGASTSLPGPCCTEAPAREVANNRGQHRTILDSPQPRLALGTCRAARSVSTTLQGTCCTEVLPERWPPASMMLTDFGYVRAGREFSYIRELSHHAGLCKSHRLAACA